MIPDPTGISQGTAGAITLTNSFSGDDTCLFGILHLKKQQSISGRWQVR